MNIISKKELASIANETGFIDNTIEKVYRLVDILEDVFVSPIQELIVLKNGTAINLSIFNLPRLSVNIDFDYVILDRDKMLKDRVIIREFIIKLMSQKGYILKETSRNHFALDSLVFRYINLSNNNDIIKIDINYLDRVHIMDFDNKLICNSIIQGKTSIRTVKLPELFGSKISALLSRCKPRDLYDVYGLVKSNIDFDRVLLKKCSIFYASLNQNFDFIENDFACLDGLTQNNIYRMLLPVISRNERFDLNRSVNEVRLFLRGLFVLDEDEKLYIEKFKKKIYLPNLLFEQSISERLLKHPMAQWILSDRSNH